MAEVIATLADHARLVQSLARTLRAEQTIETHISTVLLAGDRALKLKKPVDFGFLDFRTLAAREHCCREELRINQRSAPRLYRAVLAVAGTLDAPRLTATAAPGESVLDWAVEMQRFDPAQTLDCVVERGALTVAQVEALAAAVAQLHQQADCAPMDAAWGRPASVQHWSDDNLSALRDLTHAPADRTRLDALAAWSAAEFARLAPLIAQRHADGWVRECHGDLHLGNAVLIDGAPVLFDALEFDPALRFIDVVNDIAFLFMDLLDHGALALAWRLVGTWAEHTGDWPGLALLRWYATYRALVRAKVAQLRAQQPGAAQRDRLRAHATAGHYLALAESLTTPAPPRLLVMSGLSGSGKSQAAAELAAQLGALRVRSDVERKRLAGLAPQARGDAALYTPAMTAHTYARLGEIAGCLLDAGLSVVVDSAALRADERRALAAVAQARGRPVHVVLCSAPVEVLRQRIVARTQEGRDPSDATLAVLAAQQHWQEARAHDEPTHLQLDTDGPTAALHDRCHALLARLPA